MRLLLLIGSFFIALSAEGVVRLSAGGYQSKPELGNFRSAGVDISRDSSKQFGGIIGFDYHAYFGLLCLDFGFFYAREKFRVNQRQEVDGNRISNSKYTVSANRIIVPFSLQIDRLPFWFSSIGGGVYGSVIVGDVETSGTITNADNIDTDFNGSTGTTIGAKSDYGLMAHLTFHLFRGIFVEARYFHGLDENEGAPGETIKTRAWAAVIGKRLYLF